MQETELDLRIIKKRALKGLAALTGRTFLLQLIAFFGFFFLTVLLDQAEVGLFFAVSELVAILGYFSDVGLAAALIQKEKEVDLDDVRSTFTIQQILVSCLVLLVFALTPWLKEFYEIEGGGVFLLRALTVGFFLASLKTIPSVLLERKLRFDLLVIVELAETLLFYGLAVFLAWRGFGVASYAWAILARGVVGVILIHIVSPWQVGFRLRKESLRHLLRFGVPYQANTFLAVIKDRLMNVFLWKVIGATGVGILGWAQKWAQMPLRFIMDGVLKVSFPAYSRMQANKKELQRAVEKTLFFTSLLIFPLLMGIGILAKPLILVWSKYAKWEVALFALYFYLINSAWGAITTPLTNALSAVGKIKTVFRLMIMWVTLTWIFFPLLAIKFGYNGVAVAAALVATSSIIALVVARRQIEFSFFSSVGPATLAALVMGGALFFLRSFLGQSLIGFGGLIASGGLLYFGVIYLLLGKKFLIEVKGLLHAFKKEK